MPEHISRKELKQDKIKETIEHGAEAVISHGQLTLIVVVVLLLVALGVNQWIFHRRFKGLVPTAGKTAAALSLSLWVGVIVLGRAIAYL